MRTSVKQPHVFHRLSRAIASSALGTWFFSKVLYRLDKPIFRLTQGKQSAASILAGLPLLMLTTQGARSGLARTVPLLAIPDGDNYVLVATNWGQSHAPSWYYNLRAHPEATLTRQGASERPYRAQEVTGETWEQLWQKAVATYAGYAAYQTRIAASSNRPIPILLMTPIEETTEA